MGRRSKVHPSSVAAPQRAKASLLGIMLDEGSACPATLRRVESPKSEAVSSDECRRKTPNVRSESIFTFYVLRLTHHTSRFNAFTLLELMIVVGIMGIVLSMGVPLVYRLRHEAPLRKGVKDVIEVCSYARALAILQ